MVPTETAAECFDERMRRGGIDAVREGCLQCQRTAGAYERIKSAAGQLTAKGIPCAIAGGLAMAVHGAFCGAWELILVVPPQHVEEARALIRSLKDELGFTRVDAVAVPGIPDPVDVRVEVDGVNYLRLVALIEMKLALAAAMPKYRVHAGDVSGDY